MSELLINEKPTGAKVIKDENGKITLEGEFAEFGNITYDYPKKYYGSYIWSKEKKTWIKKNFE